MKSEAAFGTACTCQNNRFIDFTADHGPAVEVWQCRFAAECVADVTARTLTAEAPSYATIMDLDRKVREFPMPEGIDSAPSDDIAASFQRCVLEHIRETGASLFTFLVFSYNV